MAGSTDPDALLPGIDGVSSPADLASALRQLRRRHARQNNARELSYRELARLSGYSFSIVSEYFNGTALPPVDRFDVLVQLLGATPAELRALSTARDRVAEERWKNRVATHEPNHAPEHRPDWQRAFGECLRPRIDAAAEKLHDGPLREQFARQLELHLVRLTARTFVLELHRARRQGLLAGATPAERFADFARQLVGGSELAAIFERYPVLESLLDQTCQHAVAARQELMARLDADRDRVVATLLGGFEPGEVVGIESAGDLHGGGRSTAILTFADGRRVVYKPRPLGLHAWFNEVIRWFDGETGLGLATVELLAGEGYGWLGFVEHAACADHAGVSRFYRREGALLALLYVLDGSDMHYENLIAAGDQPLLVDVETLFSPAVVPPTIAGRDPAAAALNSSVQRTGLLPLLLVGEHGVFDISGIGGDAGANLPAAVVGWADAGLDTMRLVRQAAPASGAQNRPRVGSRVAEPRDHQAALLAGFGIGYDAIASSREELARRLERAAAEVVRFVPRATSLYAALMEESTHPDALGASADREKLFSLLWEDTPDDLYRQLVPHEIADLVRGDVPLFTARPGSGDVMTTDGTCLTDLLSTPGLTAVQAKLAGLSEIDLERQQWVIEAGLSTRPRVISHQSGETWLTPAVAAPPDPQRLLSVATGIADEIVGRAISDENRSNWLGLELVDDRQWAVLPLGAGLSSGYCGTALFLAQMAALTGASRYDELARDAIRPLPRLLESWSADREIASAIGSGLHGLGGICYALLRLGELLDDPQLTGWLEATLDLAETLLSVPTEFPSYADGAAGGLAAMLAIQARTDLPIAARLASGYAEQLVTAVEAGAPVSGAEPRVGFARGYTGIGWALTHYADAVGDPRCHDAGRAAFNVDSAYEAARPGRFDPGWCSGDAGRILAHGAWSTPAELVPYLATAGFRPQLRELSLCHGELGALEPLVALASRGNSTARSVLERRTSLVLGIIEQDGVRCGSPDGIRSPGLLTGLAGIGYGLLRLGFGDTLPSVLMLEPAWGTKEQERKPPDDRARPNRADG